MKVERIKISKIDYVENSRAKQDKNLGSLMNSIQQNTLLQPIGLEIKDDGRFKIKFGNRRLNACIKLGWTSIPAVLFPKENDNVDLKVKNLVENIQRENISPAEIGRLCESLERENKLTPEQISIRLGMPLSTIKSLLNLYKEIPPAFRDKVIFHKLGMRKNGQLSVDNVTKILNMRSKFGLSKDNLTTLIEKTKDESLSNKDIQIIGSLIQSGVSFTKALGQKNQFRTYRVDVPAFLEEVEELARKAGISQINYLIQIIYGLQEPISKPHFIDFDKMQNRIITKSK